LELARKRNRPAQLFSNFIRLYRQDTVSNCVRLPIGGEANRPAAFVPRDFDGNACNIVWAGFKRTLPSENSSYALYRIPAYSDLLHAKGWPQEHPEHDQVPDPNEQHYWE
jgi:hypothetical protein